MFRGTKVAVKRFKPPSRRLSFIALQDCAPDPEMSFLLQRHNDSAAAAAVADPAVAAASAARARRASVAPPVAATAAGLRNSMRVLTGIRHPCVTTVMGVADLAMGVWKLRRSCVVMELMEFGSLGEVLRNKTFPLTADLALGFLRNVAAGMRFLHSARPAVLHGDLKSSNVLVDARCCAKISDFGQVLNPITVKALKGTPARDV